VSSSELGTMFPRKVVAYAREVTARATAGHGLNSGHGTRQQHEYYSKRNSMRSIFP
jgi:hypothetical protein